MLDRSEERGSGLGASPAEFIGRMIGVARRSGLTVVASSYENKTLLKKPLLDLTRARVCSRRARSKNGCEQKSCSGSYGSYPALLLAFLLLPPPSPRVIKNGIIARADLYPRFYDNKGGEKRRRRYGGQLCARKNAWIKHRVGWSWVVNRGEILSTGGII